ncbi:MAG: FAD-dependent oxidoreductase [Sulfuricurvum sp. PC08-66]|nr:MAG: FAD-dependent oxidoreductase [Sulfuricurvum sp. PC08-66]
MRIAVLGAGISGLGAAYMLSQKHHVDLYEKEARLGGHARTTIVQEAFESFGVDTGFLVFNHATYPLLTRLFEKLGVVIEKSDMSFGFWDTQKDIAYSGDSLKGLFFQAKNLLRPSHWRMIVDILRFNAKAHRDLQNNHTDLDRPLGEYLSTYSTPFKERYLFPMGAAIWSTPSQKMHDFPARTFLNFFKNHGLLGVSTHHQWLTVSNGSIQYIQKLSPHISGTIITQSHITRIRRLDHGVELLDAMGNASFYDAVVMAMHAPDALSMLEDPSADEREILGAFTYTTNHAILHTDTRALYPHKGIWTAWNYKTNANTAQKVTLSYWINRLQNLDKIKEYFVSLNETSTLTNLIERIAYEHPQFDAKAIAMQSHRERINGVRHTYYAGAYWRYGFHEDGLWSAHTIAQKLGCDL